MARRSRPIRWSGPPGPPHIPSWTHCPARKRRACISSTSTWRFPSGLASGSGDCAVVPDRKTGQSHPPTANTRCAKGKWWPRMSWQPFEASRRSRSCSYARALAPIGKRTGVANILGVNFSGSIAWWLWRTIYLMKLPRFEKKVLVALDLALCASFQATPSNSQDCSPTYPAARGRRLGKRASPGYSALTSRQCAKRMNARTSPLLCSFCAQAHLPRHRHSLFPMRRAQVHGFLLKLRGETPSLLAHEAPPFADYARKVSTKSGEDHFVVQSYCRIIVIHSL